MPLRLIHVVRNPFDMVARIAKQKIKDGTDEERRAKATAYIGRLAGINDEVITRGGYPVLTVRQESLIADPRAELTGMCEFLGVEAPPDYLDACAGIVFPEPHQTRGLLEWSDEQVAAVEQVIAAALVLQRVRLHGLLIPRIFHQDLGRPGPAAGRVRRLRAGVGMRSTPAGS